MFTIKQLMMEIVNRPRFTSPIEDDYWQGHDKDDQHLQDSREDLWRYAGLKWSDMIYACKHLVKSSPQSYLTLLASHHHLKSIYLFYLTYHRVMVPIRFMICAKFIIIISAY